MRPPITAACLALALCAGPAISQTTHPTTTDTGAHDVRSMIGFVHQQ
jgi:hypothetical protein